MILWPSFGFRPSGFGIWTSADLNCLPPGSGHQKGCPRSECCYGRAAGSMAFRAGRRKYMKIRTAGLLSLFVCSVCTLGFAQDAPVIHFQPPPKSGGKSVMKALHERKTIREISSDKLPNKVLGNLLWAAFGINRPENGHRTAPSAMNSQEVDIYVAMQDGLYLYEPKPHQLTPVSNEDLRRKTSGQAFGTNAPVTLIFVADLSRLDKAKPETRIIYANFDAGCISQNVYLFCAAEDLATVVHDLDRAPLIKAMNLRPEQHIVMAQAVGWPKK